MKAVSYIIFFWFLFFLAGYGCSPTMSHSTDTSSQNFENLCEEFDRKEEKNEIQKMLKKMEYKCCQKSLKIIKKYSYQVLSSRQTTCPKGTEKNIMECIGTLHWCVPKTASSNSPYVSLKDLDYLCEIRGGCCQVSLDRIRKNSYLVLKPSADLNACPKGTKRNVLRCKGSLSWCVPEGKLPYL